MQDLKMLETRIQSAKRFLNSELTQIKLGTATTAFSLNEVTNLKDKLHEAERVGLRNLNDLDFIRVQRLLTSVEANMKLPRN